MFGFIGRLFGSDKAGEKIIDNVSSGIDKMWYTSEEKAEDAAQAKREGMAVYMKWLESTSGSRLARRVIALIVTGIWAVEHIASVILGVVAVFMEGVHTVVVDGETLVVENSARFIEASDMLAEQAAENNALVGVVLLFYFGGPAAMEGTKALVTKWVDKSNG